MWGLQELQTSVLRSKLVDECRCLVAANGTLTLELVKDQHHFVVAGVARRKDKTLLEQLLEEIRTALEVAQKYPA